MAFAGLNGGIEGKRVLITAGAAGIGLATARLLAELGARLLICDISDEALDATSNELSVSTLRADVSREADVDRLFETVSSTLGGLDALINNAGIAGPTGAIEDISVADWRACLDVGLTGQFLCARRAVPMLKAAGGGSIVSMASVAGKHGFAFRTPYSAAKFGVIGLTQSLAKELGPHGIRVNAILPGIVEGSRIEAVIEARARYFGIGVAEMAERYRQTISLRRMTPPEDIAATVAFLLSDAARNISGQSLAVDGNVETL